MLIMVTGGSGSGKSALAESIAHSLTKENKLYVATMIADGREAQERIAKHKKQRADKGFTTLEIPTHLEKLKITGETCLLLECMSNLAANEMYDSTGVKQNVIEHIINGISGLKCQIENIIIVTNEVFSGYEKLEDTKEYLKILGGINQDLADMADIVIEVVYGIPIIHKGNCSIKGGRLCRD